MTAASSTQQHQSGAITASAESNLTPAQRLLWLGQKLVPDSPLYNMAFLFRLSGELEMQHFQAAFQALVQNCDALRMVVEEQDGIPQRRVLETMGNELLLLDFSSEADPQAAVQVWAKERSQRQFDLSHCLFDTALIRLSDDCHAWYLNQHHLITDIESVKLVYEAQAKLYRLSVEGRLDQAEPLPAYGDISLSAPSQRAMDYWQQQMATGTGAVSLYHRSQTQVQPKTRRVFCELGAERTAALKQLAIASPAQSLTPQLSLFNLVSSIFLAYLHRISGQAKVAFTTPAHGRTSKALKETIGVFIELFPLQAEIEPDETFASLMAKVSQASGGLLRYAQAGASEFALKSRASAGQQNHSKPSNSDVNVVLNFIPTQLSEFDGLAVQSDWVHPEAGDPRHHLRLQVHDFDGRGSLQLHFDWNCDLFELELQERAISHFLTLVDAVLADTEQAIAQVPLVSAPEIQALLDLGRCDAVEVTKTVVQQFEQQVAQTPDAVAISCEGEQLTYQQLNAQANQLAHHLIQSGVVTEVTVGIYLRRSPQMLIALWAILKAGGAHVPLDPSHPVERIAHILNDTQVSWVFTSADLVHQLNDKAQPLLLDQLDLTKQPTNNPVSDPKLGQLAYLLYTSGSTGQPKGVEIEHRGLANYAQWAAQQYVRGRSLAFPLFSPLTFDLTVTSIYVPLISGGQVVIYLEGEAAIDLSLQRIFQDNAVDVIKLTPSHLALVQGMALGSRVKTLILGGEDFKTSLAQAIVDSSDHPLEIYNEYGPTEATVGCMIQRFEPVEVGQSAPSSVPIGKPAASSAIYLLDEQLNLAPQGSVGEIFIGGPGLARGYLKRPALTEERFVTCEIGGQEQRLYRTGDLGRWLATQALAYLGRSDRQVKIHGTRIELGEIEVAIAAHPAITASTVTLIQPKLLPIQTDVLSYCSRCGIASNYPGIQFDDQGVCDICHAYETYRDRTEQYFRPMDELRSQLDAASQRKQSQYDCMMLLSGGKDSTYALAQLVHMGYEVFAFTLDNGYISEEAKANARRVVETLGVDHQFGSTPAMNEIFVDSLNRFCNVCNGCFKTIYTLSMKLAQEMGIPCIVTGLSRGQFFETRLTEEWFTELFGQDEFDVNRIDETILEARKAYHRADDAVSRLMDVEVFKDDQIFEQVQILDFYRYSDVELAEMMAFLRDQVPWIRPSDTGRSTNCLINNVGIHVHTQIKGYHNYALPYSWDVRMGHKTPQVAIDELNDEIDLGEVERILREIGYGELNQAQLAAYVVGSATATELRTFLAQRLPSNLIPAYFINLEQMPLTANGKVDFEALPDPRASRPELQAAFVAPQTIIEQTLAQLWQQVLNVDRIGIHDNFFDLGCDSIMAIQIAARLSESGFSISPNQLFQYPTLAALAEIAAPEVSSTTEPVTGTVPLTPIQQHWLEQNPQEPEQFTQTVQLSLSEPLDPQILQSALAALVDHHDSLRLSYVQTAQGWEQSYQEIAVPVQLTVLEQSAQSSEQRNLEIADTTESLQTQLNLAKGDLLRAALFNSEDSAHLTLVIHHLAVDAVSWLTLLKDLETAYQQLSQGQSVLLPLKTSSFKAWTEGLQQVELPQAEQDYWLQALPVNLARLDQVSPSTTAKVQTVSKQLSPKLTQQLLQHFESPQVLLLSAIALAMQKQTGKSAIRIDLEGHGREEALLQNITPPIRLVRTVGWFTSLFPILFKINPTDSPSQTLRSIKTTLNQLPNKGIGYGILRYIQQQNQLQQQPPSEILFNYLGQLEQILPPDSIFRFAEPLQVSRSPDQPRSHPLDISAFIHKGQLQIDWQASGLAPDSVKALAEQTQHQLQTLLNPSTPQEVAVEDFPMAQLNHQKLDKLAALLNKADRTKTKRSGGNQ